jgi:hypothetical protein
VINGCIWVAAGLMLMILGFLILCEFGQWERKGKRKKNVTERSMCSRLSNVYEGKIKELKIRNQTRFFVFSSWFISIKPRIFERKSDRNR